MLYQIENLQGRRSSIPPTDAKGILSPAFRTAVLRHKKRSYLFFSNNLKMKRLEFFLIFF